MDVSRARWCFRLPEAVGFAHDVAVHKRICTRLRRSPSMARETSSFTNDILTFIESSHVNREIFFLRSDSRKHGA